MSGACWEQIVGHSNLHTPSFLQLLRAKLKIKQHAIGLL
jgi:hypothetical protein